MAMSQPHSLSGVCCCSPNSQLIKHSRPWFFNKKRGAALDHLLFNRAYSRKRCRIKLSALDDENLGLSRRLVDFRSQCLSPHKSRMIERLLPQSSADDGVTVNGRSSESGDVEDMRVKLNQSLQGEDSSSALVQSLHDAARVYELAIKDQSSQSKKPWFSTAWLGVDQNAWLKALSYQAAVYSVLQAASEISSRGDGRDRDINVFVQRSLLRQSAPLESIIRDEISAKQPEEQYPRGKDQKGSDTDAKRYGSNPLFFWNFFARGSSMKSGPRSAAYRRDGEPLDQASVSMSVPDSEANEFQRFEQLRNELMELENRVQKGARRSDNEEGEIKIRDDTTSYSDEAEGNLALSVQVQKKENIIERSLDKFKETTTVTAVGHAAMLAAIQRYVPSMIPSTYGPERLDLLRQLEKVKELESTEANPTDSTNET